MDEHPEAVDGRAARPPRRPAAAPSPAGGTRGRRRPGRRRSSAGSNGSSSVPIPTDVALTTMSAPAIVAGRRRRARRRPARPPPRPVSAVRLTTTTSAGAGPAERVDDAAGRGAGADHDHRAAGDVDARRGQRGDEAVAVGAVADEAPAVAADDGVDRAQRGRRRGELVDGRGDVLLVRRRHRQAADAERAHGVERGAGAAGRDVEGDVRPVEPGRRRTRRCASPATASGATGWPMTAATRHGVPVSRAGRRRWRPATLACVLLGGDREGVVARPRRPARSTGTRTACRPGSAGAQRVTDARVRRRVQGRPDRRPAGVGDRRRRQPRVQVRVLRTRRLALLVERDGRRGRPRRRRVP